MENLPPVDRSESPEERAQRRRARRWMRRARMAAPFLGVSAVLATLALSIDLIEYQPEPPTERRTNRPIPGPVHDRGTRLPAPTPSTLSAASVLGSEPASGRDLLGNNGSGLDVDLAAEAPLAGDRPTTRGALPSTADTPTPPSRLRTGR
jgi:hypothetical protein